MVRLIGKFWVVSHERLTHPWDACSYLIGGDEPALVDCGSSGGYPVLKRVLQSAGLQPKDIRTVVATHCHWDHLSGMAQLREESDARLLVHATERPYVENGDAERTAAFLYAQPFPPVEVDGVLDDGATLELGDYRFDVVHTPGHSPGSVSLCATIEDLRVLIAGDALWGGFHPAIGSDLDAWRRSLDRLLEREFDVFTFGHGPPALVFDATTRLREARQQLGVYFNPWFKPFHTTFRY
jgi:glyoxylase-like metal-dependent hydrolase (beta-lactamase superfamily II)